MIKLHVVPADGPPFERSIDSESLTIGRSSKADLMVPDRSMSRMHARLFKDGERWHVEDLGSRNGTLLGSQPVSRATRLSAGATLQVGSTTVTIRDVGTRAGSFSDLPLSSAGKTILRPAAELLREPEALGSDASEQVGDDIRRYAERLKLLSEVHQALDRSMAQGELLELILDRAFKHLQPEQGAIYLKNGGNGYVLAATRTVGTADQQILFSTSLLHEVVDGRQAALVLDAQSDERFHEAASLLDIGVRSLVAAPLLDTDGALGLIVLGSRLAIRQFSEEDMELLASLATVAAMRIRNVRLAEEAEERKRLEREVELAREIQVGLLPDSLPEIPGWEIVAGNIPSRGVSGDFYKIEVRHHGDECVVMIADVSGKGVAASLLTASLEALTAGPIHDGVAPVDICTAASHLLFERTPPEKYATAFVMAFHPDTGELTYCNAGHNPAIVLRFDGEVQWLESTGLPLGIMPTASFCQQSCTLAPGETIVLYTDGITEAEDPDEEEYGEDRLRSACIEHRHRQLEEFVAALEDDLYAFVRGAPFADDRTVVAIRRSTVT